jgi:hypothetical protein
VFEISKLVNKRRSNVLSLPLKQGFHVLHNPHL